MTILAQSSWPIAKVRPNPSNPPSRTNATALAALCDNIRQHGILAPLVITADGTIIDGHRRLACAVSLGFDSVPVVIHDGDASVLFAAANSDTRRLTPSEWGHGFLNGLTVPARMQDELRLLARTCGEDALRIVVEAGLSPTSLYKVARKVCTYCGMEPETSMRQALLWLASTRSQRPVEDAMRGHVAPAVLVNAMDQNKPIRPRWGIPSD